MIKLDPFTFADANVAHDAFQDATLTLYHAMANYPTLDIPEWDRDRVAGYIAEATEMRELWHDVSDAAMADYETARKLSA